MRTAIKSLKSVAIGAAALASCMSFGADSALDQTVNAFYKASDALTLKMDMEGLKTLLTKNATSDYKHVSLADKSGNIRKFSLIQLMDSRTRSMDMISAVNSVATKVGQITPSKDKATVKVTSVLKMTSRPSKDGKSHIIVDTAKSVETWVKIGPSWKLQLSKTTSNAVTLDGRAMPRN